MQYRATVSKTATAADGSGEEVVLFRDEKVITNNNNQTTITFADVLSAVQSCQETSVNFLQALAQKEGAGGNNDNDDDGNGDDDTQEGEVEENEPTHDDSKPKRVKS